MFLPENIDLAHSEKYSLSIRVSPNGFSFCIYSPKDPAVFHYQETPLGKKLSLVEGVQKIIFDSGFFGLSFKETIVTIASPHYTLVPDAFFDTKQKQECFDFNCYNIDGIVLSDQWNDCHLLYKMDANLHSFLLRHLWNPTFQHSITPLLTFFQRFEDNCRKNRCFVDFHHHDSSISVVCFSSENNLLSASTFSTTCAHDVSYFVASVWEQNEFDQTEDKLYFSGNIEWYQSDILKKLIKNMEIIELRSPFLLDAKQKKLIPTDILANFV